LGSFFAASALRATVKAAKDVARHLSHTGIFCEPTMGRCATILAAAVTLSLYACSRAPSTVGTISLMNSATDRPPGTGAATLSWMPPRRNLDGSAVSNLAGYYIYYGTSPTNLNHAIKLLDPYTTTYTVHDLSPGTYYFSIVAFTTTGTKGSASPSVSKMIP
jgi:hypothetical protein